MKPQVFISYSHKDQRWLDTLLNSLRHYEREGHAFFRCWSDRDIKPGQVWRNEIQEALMQSKVAVLLVTQHFFESDFIAQKELQPLLALAESSGVQILWMALSASPVLDSAIASYQALNNPGRPLDLVPRPQRNLEFVRIAKHIYETACGHQQTDHRSEDLLGRPAKSHSFPTNADHLQPGHPNRSIFRKNNFDTFPELRDYIGMNQVQSATLIQMSCLNERHLLRELWSAGARIELYISAANIEFGVSKWQKDRIARFLEELPNELQNIDPCKGSCRIDIYKYNAPASIRAVLIDDKILTSGPYLYQKHRLGEQGNLLDVRGAELPLLLLTRNDPDFETVRVMILRLIENWKREKVAEHIATYRYSDIYQPKDSSQ